MLGKPSMYLNSRGWPLEMLCVARAWTRQVLLPTSCIPHLLMTTLLRMLRQKCSDAVSWGGAQQPQGVEYDPGGHHAYI